MMGAKELKKLKFFQNVSDDTVEKLWEQGHIREYPKHSVVLSAKVPAEEVFVLMSGKCMVYNLVHTGKRKILFVFGEGTLLNESIWNAHHVSNYCETMEKSKVFAVSRRLFEECMREDFTVVRAVLEASERRVWRLSHQLKNTMGSIYMERKLAAKMWKLARDFGVPRGERVEIDINMSVTFLADMLGAPRETTSRLCKTLTEYGLIEMKNKRIFVDPKKLSAFYKTGKII